VINFSSGLIFLLGALAALGAAAIDMYLPSLPSIESELGGVGGSAQFTLSSFFIGLGLGQLFYGPISDSLGRRKVLVVGLLIYCLGSLFCFFAGTMMELVAARFFQALGAAAGGVIARAMVRDVFSGKKVIPKWITSFGIEWLYRLIKEPKRMWRRYLFGNTYFLFKFLTQKYK